MIERFLVRFPVDAIILCVYFSVLFTFLLFFFFLSFFGKKTESEGKHMLLENMSSLKVRVLPIKVRLPVLLCAVKTVEGDFRFCWTTTPNLGQTHKENPNLVRILYMVCTLNDIYKQYNKLHEH